MAGRCWKKPKNESKIPKFNLLPYLLSSLSISGFTIGNLSKYAISNLAFGAKEKCRLSTEKYNYRGNVHRVLKGSLLPGIVQISVRHSRFFAYYDFL